MDSCRVCVLYNQIVFVYIVGIVDVDVCYICFVKCSEKRVFFVNLCKGVMWVNGGFELRFCFSSFINMLDDFE